MKPTLIPELFCSDFERSLSFYVDLVGFQVLYDRKEERFAYLNLNGAELMLAQPLNQDRLYPKAQLEHPYGRGINLEIHVENVNEIHAKITKAGFPEFLPIEEKWYKRKSDEIGVRQFAVQDPDGYLIRFSQEIGIR